MMWLYRLFCKFWLWVLGWHTKGNVPENLKKYVLVLAPHTSNWDFVYAILARSLVSNTIKSYFFAKSALFIKPFGWFFRALGGIPIDRSQKNDVVAEAVKYFRRHREFVMGLTPEGTRSKVERWKSGFYYIALEAKVPIVCSYLDYYRREAGIGIILQPSGDFEKDMEQITDFYKNKIPHTLSGSSLNHPVLPYKSRLPNRLKSILRLSSALAALFLLLYYQSVWYGIHQGYGQFQIIYQAKPVDEFLASNTLTEEQKRKLLLIGEIKKFAEDSLGLTPSQAYQTMYDQKGQPILWMLTASKPYELKAKTWDFPILGTFSYKGFFDYQKAKQEEDALKTEGWETAIDEVSAWSTLGFLNDPILSSMLNKSEGNLANLIIHELTHGTLYIKNNVSYNENLASFIGDEGAKRFLRYKYGENSIPYHQYSVQKQDRELFRNYLQGATLELDSLYQSIRHLPEHRKRRLKSAMIRRIVTGADTITFSGNSYRNYFKYYKPNNAFFMSYRRYHAQENIFKEEFEQKFHSNFKEYIAHLKKTYPRLLF